MLFLLRTTAGLSTTVACCACRVQRVWHGLHSRQLAAGQANKRPDGHVLRSEFYLGIYSARRCPLVDTKISSCELNLGDSRQPPRRDRPGLGWWSRGRGRRGGAVRLKPQNEILAMSERPKKPASDGPTAGHLCRLTPPHRGRPPQGSRRGHVQRRCGRCRPLRVGWGVG